MIRVTIELIPFGNEQEAKKIAEMVIANDGTSQNGLNSYAAMPPEYLEIPGPGSRLLLARLLNTIEPYQSGP